MDISLERDGTAIGSLFQQIINDMKNTSPLWEDFMAKASKLHACLRATIQAIAAYLDAFQKIADAATNSKGATKEIGTALTRVCLRHKAVETRMKSFTTAIMDCLIIPLQDKLEDWKRQAIVIDKDHAKEHKRCRTELKKRSSDTLRLQKKAKKGQTDTIQSMVENSMQDINQKRAELDAVERKSLRAAMVEERMRYCTFVNLLQPVVKEECEVMYELGHLQEAMDSIAIVTKEPTVLPQASEELILESKTSINFYSESPVGSNAHGCSNSLGSRKSSVCSISSLNSSDSSGSPGHQYQRSLSQLISPTIRLKPGESSDSGFCSSSALTSQTSTSSNPAHAVSTWPPHSQEAIAAAAVAAAAAAGGTTTDRPHTISTAYEKGHQRPALTVYTFQSPEIISEAQKSSPANVLCRPPLPIRCSSLERPLSTSAARNSNTSSGRQCPSPLPAHVTKEHPIFQPTYVNMSELASMAASKITNNANNQHQHQQQQQQQQQMQYQLHHHQQPPQINSPVLSIASSLVSSDSSATNHQSSPDISADTATPQINSPNTNDSLPETPIASSAPPISTPTTTNNSSNSAPTTNNTTTTMGVIENNVDPTNNKISSTTTNPPSPENDFKSIGSVLEKLSMFEKIQNNNVAASTPPSANSGTATPSSGGSGGGLSAATLSKVESILNRKNEEIYKAIGSVDKDPDQIYEDSIQELNNLIGELDSFQKEHERSLAQTNGHTTMTSIPSNAGPNNTAIIPIDTDSCYDRISIGSSNIGSLGYSIPSNTSSECKFNYNCSDVQRYFNENHSSSGFDSNDSNTEIIHIQESHLNESELYVKENAEIVVLRRKDSAQDLNKIIDVIPGSGGQPVPVQTPQQRFSSFKSDIVKLPRDEYKMSCVNMQQPNDMSYDEVDSLPPPPPPTNSVTSMNDFKMSLDERLRIKPIISPRPASLSGCVSRITRRSSINSTKPPPPVRRSSSVTPSHHLGVTNSPSLSQQNLMNTSSESLPPPPAYLLDSSGRTSPGKVGETVKALTELRHMPASPGVIRRAQALAQMQQMQQQSPPIVQQFAQNHTSNTPPPPQHHNHAYVNSSTPHRNDMLLSNAINSSSVSSMYSTTPTTGSTNTHNYTQNTAAQILPPSTPNSNDSSFNNTSYRTTPNSSSSSSSQSGIYAQPKQVSKMSSFRNASPVGTPKQQPPPNSNLMAQLNARINKQSGGDHHNQQIPNNDKKLFGQSQAIYDSRNNVQHQQQLRAEQKSQQRANHYHQQQQLQQQQQQQQQQQHHHQQQMNEAIYTRAADRNHHYQQQQQQMQQQQQQYIQSIDDYSSNYEKTSSTRQKTKVGFLENLNAKLAEQRLSGKAFAVRNLINSKALPDPRICHESLMDQIKRGATLKRNKSINDRSAPKIH